MSDPCAILQKFINMFKQVVDHDTLAVKMQPQLRKPTEGLRSCCMPSIDYTDKTSWYQNAKKATNVLLHHENSDGNRHTYAVPGDMMPIINIHHPSLTYPYIYYKKWEHGFKDEQGDARVEETVAGLPLNNGLYAHHQEYLVYVAVNGGLVEPSEFEIDYRQGKIIFKDRVMDTENDVVSASYFYVNDRMASEFIVRPPNNSYTWDVKHTEIQVSKSVIGPMPTLMFELWAGREDFDYDFNDPLTGLAYQIAYRSSRDYMNIGNEGKGFIPGFGGGTDTLVFPFMYSTSIQLGKSADGDGALFRTYIIDDKEIKGGEMACISYYIEEVPYNPTRL